MPAPPAAPALALEAVVRGFRSGLRRRRREALRGVDLSLERGRTLGLVGPNGSGKSTLLRIVAGADRASGGRVGVLGATPDDPRVRARLAYLPEDSPFPGELSGMGVMTLLGSLSGLSRRETRERAARLLEHVGLGAHARAPLRSYSRGMQRRFGLAQAFLNEPELVLLDEPTAGLDALGFGVLEELLEDARASGATVVIASHVLSDVHDHCDELALLFEGRIAARGAPGELLGSGGRVELVVEGLEEAALARLADWVAEHGGRVAAQRPGGSLLELYRRFAVERGG